MNAGTEFFARLEHVDVNTLEGYADSALVILTLIDLVFRRRFPDARTQWEQRVAREAGESAGTDVLGAHR